MARKSKLTSARQARIVEAIKEGQWLDTAARIGGISPSTFFAWMQKGEQASSGAFRAFFETVEEAKCHAEALAVGLIEQAARGLPYKTIRTVTGEDGSVTTTEGVTQDWRAAAWLLERRYPDRYSPRQKLEHSGEINCGVLAVPAAPTSADWAAAAEAQQRELAKLRSPKSRPNGRN